MRKRGVKKQRYLTILLISMVIISGVLVSAGFFDWFGKVTGEATSDTTTVALTITNSPPNIINITASLTPALTAASTTEVELVFAVMDDDGAADIDNATIDMNFTLGANEDSHVNTSCIYINGSNATSNWYNCGVLMDYWDNNTAWTVNIMANDTSSSQDIDSTRTVTPQALNGMTMNVTSVSFGSVGVAATDIQNTGSPVSVFNRGNVVQWTEVTAVNLLGYNAGSPTTDYMIPASDMEIDDTAAACTGGTALVNATATNITVAAAVYNGENFFGDRYFCIESLWSNLTVQDYNTTGYGEWTIATTIS